MDKRSKDIRSNGQKVESGQNDEWIKGGMDKRSKVDIMFCSVTLYLVSMLSFYAFCTRTMKV